MLLQAAVWNGALAVGAGVLANIVSEWLTFGPVAPFIVAIPCLVIAGIVVATQWEENYAKTPVKFAPACASGLRAIATSPRIFLLGILQSCFESAMYIFIFLWTPVLAPAHPSFGMVYLIFVVCFSRIKMKLSMLKRKGMKIGQITGSNFHLLSFQNGNF